MPDNTNGYQLRTYVERFERLQAEIDDLKADQKKVLASAKAVGFDLSTLREILRLRRLERQHGRASMEEREALVDTYKSALGMLCDTPLGAAAMARGASAGPSGLADDGQGDIEDYAARKDAA